MIADGKGDPSMLRFGIIAGQEDGNNGKQDRTGQGRIPGNAAKAQRAAKGLGAYVSKLLSSFFEIVLK